MKLKGRLLYMGWFNLPWKLVTNESDIDLWPIISEFLISLDGQHANHEQKIDSYTLSADKSSEFQLKYVPGESLLLEKPDSFGISNIYVHLDTTLSWLSGRLIEIEVKNGKHIRLNADVFEKVFGVYFVNDGNSCEVPGGKEKTVCKVGGADCCIFLSIEANGFRCEKFNSPMARILLDRLAKGKMQATRIGNCALLGRK